ncbi:MAG: NAD(P)-dependent oxidoreductase [Deltaproteobacteria bacterium]|jgi:3-hydroxyisobutyrate dehydrogenase-like beta-hydroxyacid dehydrogenase|nr:NAD(P)-dependent oxidoreductase [Deltaproteobacteria bacterium]
MKASFIGLGRMGGHMARRVLLNKLPLGVYNRNQEKAKPLAADGAEVFSSPRDAYRDAELFITMVSNDFALNSLTTPQDLTLMAPGGVHVSMSTISVELSDALTALHASLGQAFVSCPVFGRPLAAEAGTLNLCLAGPQDAKAKAAPYLATMGKIFDFGLKPSGANSVKLAGNFMLATLIEMLSEAFSLVDKHGVTPLSFFDLISTTNFSAPAVKIYGQLLLDNSFGPGGFSAALGAKDIGLVKAAAKNSLTPMPLASTLEDRFLRILARGWEDKDWCVLGQIQKEDSGLAKPSV